MVQIVCMKYTELMVPLNEYSVPILFHVIVRCLVTHKECGGDGTFSPT